MRKSPYPQLNDVNWLRAQYPARSMRAIARELGCTPKTVDEALRYFGLKPEKGPAVRRVRPRQLNSRTWLAKQIAEKPLRQIAEEINYTYSGVRSAAINHNLTLPKRTKYRVTANKSEAVRQALQERYPDGRVGSRSSNWRGGRSKRGPYVWIHRELVEQQWPDHPRLKRKDWTVKQEHIIVREASLGRCLRRGEVVHHKNEIKDDNRPENLVEKKNGKHITDHFSEPRILRIHIRYLERLLDANGVTYEDLETTRLKIDERVRDEETS